MTNYSRQAVTDRLKLIEQNVSNARPPQYTNANQQDLNRYNNNLAKSKKKIANLKYILKRMGSANSVELPQSVLPNPNVEADSRSI